ncbi:class I SAM-dependent methyltransferase [Cyclobacterium marinum]|uniref:class I SAM-dependent methyltransferase n=1 Tax=Cyclobacterium marinum TaxID=104 RepID=UPI0011EEE65C|nr:methyltransferase domain-containing protein [Cyclobacterium marinum]MBI0397205.1 methyltransferase domain-containing protein [Cyclobacterium marinum]
MIKKIINHLLGGINLKIERIKGNDFELDLYKRNFPEESIKSKNFYNVGAGSFYHPYWTNIDYFSDWYHLNDKLTKNGINYDLFSLEAIPVNSDSAEIVYTSHTIEHIKNKNAQHLFNESYRMLKKDGIIRITCPDIDLHFSAYKNRDFHFFYWRKWYENYKDYNRIFLNSPLTKVSMEQLFMQRFATAATTIHVDGIKNPIDDNQFIEIINGMPLEDALDYCCNMCPVEIQKKYPGNHTNWWNRKKVFEMLKNSGFKNIEISGYGQSKSPVLRNTMLFDNTHPKISLYVEAQK